MSLPNTLRDGLALPVIGAPMFIVSGPDLVIAQCKAGVVGSFPSLNARRAAELENWLRRIRDELARQMRQSQQARAALSQAHVETRHRRVSNPRQGP